MKTKISFKNSKRLLEYVNNDVLTDYNKFVVISDNYYNDAVNVNNILEEFTTGTSALKTTMSEMNHGINDISTTIEESANGTNFIVLVYLHYILHNYNWIITLCYDIMSPTKEGDRNWAIQWHARNLLV